MGTIVRVQDIETDTTFEEGLAIDFGVNSETCGSKRLTMGHTIIPPGGANRWHYHNAAEAAMYVVRGRVRVLWVVDGKVNQADIGAGTFFHVHQGEWHTQENLSNTEEVEIIFAYGGVPNKEASETIFVPDPRVTAG